MGAEKLSFGGDSRGRKGAAVKEERVAGNCSSSCGLESTFWKMWERKRLRRFPEQVAELGGGSAPLTLWSFPQAGMVLDVIKTEREKAWSLSYIEENYKRAACRLLPCVPGRLGRWGEYGPSLGAAGRRDSVFMKPVKVEHMLSFWELLVPGAERGAGRLVALAGLG